LEQSLDGAIDRSTTLIVGNLPYYITSPILRQFFEHDSFIGGVFLIQKEVAEKIMTEAPKKSYLWRLLNNHYDVRYCFTVKPKCFNPPPKVDSAVISLTRKAQGEIDDTSKLL
jgi:16S rRNA (adenine1518-N6/adenine1519-N6)-dimethyltransferase